jgi:TolB-like protein/Tfp pilus assembly protein PilF
MSLIAELKRRSVFKVGAAYLVVAWLAAQAAGLAFPTFEAPVWALRAFLFMLMLGFPIALVIAWAVELTPEGIKLDAAPTGNKRMLGIAAGIFALAVAWYYLGQPAVRGEASGPPSIAVLPFSALGGDAESSGLAGGLHDTLITQLSKIKGLEVRSRTSVMKYKDWSGGLKPIAEELGVSVVLEGSVQRVGNRTVVNAQLIDARTDAHLWAETFDRTGDDLFALQSEIAQQVTKALAVALSPAEQQALAAAPTQDTEAYALYVDAMRLMNESEAETHPSAAEALRLKSAAVFEAAVAKDPQFALAWAMLARTYATITWNTRELPYAEYAAKTRAAAQRAIALGPDLPEARLAAGTVALQLDFDFRRAVSELTAATQGMPSNTATLARLAQAKAYSGDLDGATVTYERALELEPNDVTLAYSLRTMYIAARRFDEARTLSRRLAAQFPGSYRAVRMPAQLETVAIGDIAPFVAFVRSTSGGFRASAGATADRWVVEIAAGDPAAALVALDTAHEAARPDGFRLYRAETLRLLGRDAEARQEYAVVRAWLEKMISTPRDPYIEALTRCQLGYVQARLGDVASARKNAIAADRLWGVGREPNDGADVWNDIAALHVAAGDVDAALDKLTWLADNRTAFTAGDQWTDLRFASLHANPRFRALMQKHGIDMTREPFAVNRTAAKSGAPK